MSYREKGGPLFLALVLLRVWCRWSLLPFPCPRRNIAAAFFLPCNLYQSTSGSAEALGGVLSACSFPVNMLLLHWDSHLRKQKAGKQYVEKLVSMETAFFLFPFSFSFQN